MLFGKEWPGSKGKFFSALFCIDPDDFRNELNPLKINTGWLKISPFLLSNVDRTDTPPQNRYAAQS
jgi:hypothetical protein